MTDEIRTDEEQAEQDVNQLELVQKERDELLDTLQRVQAEFDNYRKRAGRGEERKG
jgi:molecular chaperone GrpE (heat shock protein)